MLRRINLGAAAIVLICFFLPWAQVSCGGAKESLTGFDLARHDSVLLWLIPLLTAGVLIFGLLRRTREKPMPLAIFSAVTGGVTLFLMNDQRSKINDADALIPAQLTGWFWLAFICAAAMIVRSVGLLLRRERST
jgi:hypothetical protein